MTAIKSYRNLCQLWTLEIKSELINSGSFKLLTFSPNKDTDKKVGLPSTKILRALHFSGRWTTRLTSSSVWLQWPHDVVTSRFSGLTFSATFCIAEEGHKSILGQNHSGTINNLKYNDAEKHFGKISKFRYENMSRKIYFNDLMW